MSNSIKPIGILGGTFDPIHHGHLRIALELYQQLDLQQIRFIPCQQPVLDKTTQATTTQRVAMLKLAINNQKEFVLDKRELKRSTPSYTIETLISLREEFYNVPLCLIMGSDSFLQLPRWHRWQELITLAHIVIIPRPEYLLNDRQAEVIKNFLIKHKIDNPLLLHEKLSGYIYTADFHPLAISSTYIRQQINNGLNPAYLLPEEVLHYIWREKIYQC